MGGFYGEYPRDPRADWRCLWVVGAMGPQLPSTGSYIGFATALLLLFFVVVSPHECIRFEYTVVEYTKNTNTHVIG